jgi:hypothetical protein
VLKVKEGIKNTGKGKYSQRNGAQRVVKWGSVSQRLFLFNIGSNNGLFMECKYCAMEVQALETVMDE